MPFVLIAALVAGCSDYGFEPRERAEPPSRLVVTDWFVQVPRPAVDLLLVVDDTASMAQEQAALGAAFRSFGEALASSEVSWQVGVVVTDMQGETPGWLVGTPWIVTPADDDPPGRLAELLQVGTGGATPEAGLAAALEALALAVPGGPNQGFRRVDAALHVLFVSDGDDGSDAWLGSDPVGHVLAALEDEAEASGRPVDVSFVVGDLPSGCTSVLATARAAPRYHELAQRAGGLVTSICAPDLAPVSERIAALEAELLDRFPLSRRPARGTARVQVDGQGVDDFRVDEPPAVVFAVPPAAGSRIEVSYFVEEEP